MLYHGYTAGELIYCSDNTLQIEDAILEAHRRSNVRLCSCLYCLYYLASVVTCLYTAGPGIMQLARSRRVPSDCDVLSAAPIVMYPYSLCRAFLCVSDRRGCTVVQKHRSYYIYIQNDTCIAIVNLHQNTNVCARVCVYICYRHYV